MHRQSFTDENTIPWHKTFTNEPGGNFSVSGETETWTSEIINISRVDRAFISVKIEAINIGETEGSIMSNCITALTAEIRSYGL